MFINVNEFKEIGFKIIVYYVKENIIKDLNKYPPKISIQPIIFFSKCFIKVEKKY